MDGTNADDLKKYRPGLKAIQELGIISGLHIFLSELCKIRTVAGLLYGFILFYSRKLWSRYGIFRRSAALFRSYFICHLLHLLCSRIVLLRDSL